MVKSLMNQLIQKPFKMPKCNEVGQITYTMVHTNSHEHILNWTFLSCRYSLVVHTLLNSCQDERDCRPGDFVQATRLDHLQPRVPFPNEAWYACSGSIHNIMWPTRNTISSPFVLIYCWPEYRENYNLNIYSVLSLALYRNWTVISFILNPIQTD